MRIKQLDIPLLKILYLAAAGIVMAQVLSAGSVASLLFMAAMALTLVLWLVGAVKKLSQADLLLIVLLIIALANVLVRTVVARENPSFDYFKKYLMFACTLMYFASMCKIRFDRGTELFMRRMNTLLVLFLIAMYFLRNRAVHVMNGIDTDYLNFCFSNPNITGLFTGCIAMMELFSTGKAKKLSGKLFHGALFCIMTWFVYETRSRNSLIAVLLLVALYCWYGVRKERQFQISRLVCAAAAVVPLPFALVYLFIVNSSTFRRIFSFMVSEGKDLTSRYSMWIGAMQKFLSSPVLGVYDQVSSLQMHNSHVDTMTTYGLIVMLLLCVYLYLLMAQTGSRPVKKSQKLYLLGFMAAIFTGIGETAIYFGGLGIYVFVGAFLLLANQQYPEETQ